MLLSAAPALSSEGEEAQGEPAQEMSQEELEKEMTKIHEEIDKLRKEHDAVHSVIHELLLFVAVYLGGMCL